MKHLTIRNVPDDLYEQLKREKSRRGESLNRTVIELLRQRLGVGTTPSNGLAGLAGRWDDTELREFEEATAQFERVDEELWR